MRLSKLFSIFWLAIIFCSFPKLGYTQSANIWYFGKYAGLDFRTNPPSPLTDGVINTEEGCASISDEQGNLLFYTDGVTVWNRFHQPMSSGQDLKGSSTSTQSVIIVPRPDYPERYYVFTSAEGGYGNEDGAQRIHYSEVDMALNNGLGNVLTANKNTFLLEPATEKLTAVRHHNGKDIWVLVHAWYSNAFHAYLVTAEGVTKQSVVSSVGTSHQGDRINTIGYLKASPSGRRLALTLYEAGVIELLDFDNQTGKISHPTTLVAPEYRQAYGVEFSPDETKLYVTAGFLPRQLYQFDLSSPIPSVESIPFPPFLDGKNVEGLQLGPDNRIYVARFINDYIPLGHLGVIQKPNEKGAACLYREDAIELPGFPDRGSLLGLPNFLPDLVTPVSFTHQGNCAGSSIAFQLAYSTRFSAAVWNFGDPASLSHNAALGFEPGHTFSDTGSYVVAVTVTFPTGKTQTITAPVHISARPAVNLGKDTLLCRDQTLLLKASHPGAQYYWQDGSTTDTFRVTKPGLYEVQVGIGNCWVSDSIEVRYSSPPQVKLGPDVVRCDNEPRLLRATFPGAHYQWSDGSADSTLIAKESGVYWVSVTNACGIARDTIKLTYASFPTVDLGRDTTLCLGDTLVLDAYSSAAQSYIWSDGSDQSQLWVSQPGTYWVSVRSQFCQGSDRIQVQVQECPQYIFIPNVFTPNGDTHNETFQVNGIQLGKWQLVVYNRLGRQVYLSQRYQNDWNGEGLESSLYYYWLRDTSSNRSYKGWVQVLR